MDAPHLLQVLPNKCSSCCSFADSMPAMWELGSAMHPVAQLAAYNLKELHHRRGDGSRQIDELYTQCRSNGLITSPPTTDARSRYEAVFDVALREHFGCWLIDYVQEVCGDTALLSNDPAEAQLLDGEFVRSWCEKTLHAIMASVVAALKSEQLFVQYLATQLHKDLGRVSVLLSVLQALQRIRTSALADRKASTSRRGVEAELKQAELLQKCFQVMAWCARHALYDKPHTGRFASVPDWLRQVHLRRDKASPGRTLFLDDLLQALRISGAYPFSSLQNMLYMLFITIQDTDQPTWESKLSLLLYYLLDLDFLQPGSQEDFCSAFLCSPAQVSCWQAMFLLDCVEQPQPGAPSVSSSHPDSSALLSKACELISTSGPGNAPFKVLQALLALGRADVALSLHWVQETSQPSLPAGGDDGILQAITLLDLRLRCGLLVEAFLAMRSHCSTLPEAKRPQHVEALVVHLLEWASAKSPAAVQAERQCGRSALQVLCELPWNPDEEDALVAWLIRQLQAGKPAGDLLPLYFLGRGQVPEALGAYNHWQLHGQSARGQSPSSAALQQPIDALVNAAAAMLPLPQRNVCITEGPGAADARWPARLLIGLSLQADGNVPVMQASVQAGSTPPFMSSKVPAQPALEASDARGAAGDSDQAAEQPVQQHAASNGVAEPALNGFRPEVYSMAVDGVAGSSLFSLPGASGAVSSFMFEGSTTGAAGEPVMEPVAPPLFSQNARLSFAEARDPKRARTGGGMGF